MVDTDERERGTLRKVTLSTQEPVNLDELKLVFGRPSVAESDNIQSSQHIEAKEIENPS